MSSRAGLFDFEFNKKSILNPEINNKGLFDPDFSTTASSSVTVAQEVPAWYLEMSSPMVGLVWSW